jgi:hypothetical protein
MTDILLTGAGFSYNWGGWLSSEAFEYLLGCPEITPQIRAALWATQNFEQTLNDFRVAAGQSTSPQTHETLRIYERMLQSMFDSMNNAFKQVELNPLNESLSLSGYPIDYVRQFLTHFDIIFTLNLDTLLELKYKSGNVMHRLSSGRWNSIHMPGVEPITQSGQSYGPPGLYKPSGRPLEFPHGLQPYIKLHGSSNWRDGEATMLIMGGNKGPDIDRHPLLKAYKEYFVKQLCQADTRLVVIGYSFQDSHINDIILRAAAVGAKLFIVDPRGVNVLESAINPTAATNPIAFAQAINPAVVGASRRGLLSTFTTDFVERAKIMRFLTRTMA